MIVLDMDGYVRLGKLRREFDYWLKEEGWVDELIIAMRFDEGFIDAECYITIDGKQTLDTEWRRLPWTTPPPQAVIEFAARRGAQSDG